MRFQSIAKSCLALLSLCATPQISHGADAPLQDPPRFQLLTRGMSKELKQRYRDAIAADPAMRAAFLGVPPAASTYIVPGVKALPIPPAAAAIVGKDAAGSVMRSDGSGVRILAGSLERNVQVTVSHPDPSDEETRNRQAAAVNIRPASLPAEFGPPGTVFAMPVTLSLPYDPALISAQGIDESVLGVHYWNPVSKAWEALPSTIDRANHTVSANTTHFSLYQVMGAGGIRLAAADTSFGLKAVYAFPNPARGVGSITIRVQPGQADSLSVRVYDLAGRKVHESSDFVDRGALDDGNGAGAQFTYDHAWDISGVASGLYEYALTVKRAGASDIHRTGKVAVIK